MFLVGHKFSKFPQESKLIPREVHFKGNPEYSKMFLKINSTSSGNMTFSAALDLYVDVLKVKVGEIFRSNKISEFKISKIRLDYKSEALWEEQSNRK